MYNAISIARYVINYCVDLGKSISNLKLQKILYFIQAEFLVEKGTPCFMDKIEAWDFGPVVPVVYHEFKKYGSLGIPSYEGSEMNLNGDDVNIVNDMTSLCMEYSASQLVSITHNQAPWKEAYKEGRYHCEITLESILSYFKKEVE